MEVVYADDLKALGTKALDAGAHGVQEAAEFLDFRLGGGVDNGRTARRADGSHEDVLRPGDLRIHHEDASAAEAGRCKHHVAVVLANNVGTQLGETPEVDVDGTLTN